MMCRAPYLEEACEEQREVLYELLLVVRTLLNPADMYERASTYPRLPAMSDAWAWGIQGMDALEGGQAICKGLDDLQTPAHMPPLLCIFTACSVYDSCSLSGWFASIR